MNCSAAGKSTGAHTVQGALRSALRRTPLEAVRQRHVPRPRRVRRRHRRRRCVHLRLCPRKLRPGAPRRRRGRGRGLPPGHGRAPLLGRSAPAADDGGRQKRQQCCAQPVTRERAGREREASHPSAAVPSAAAPSPFAAAGAAAVAAAAAAAAGPAAGAGPAPAPAALTCVASWSCARTGGAQHQRAARDKHHRAQPTEQACKRGRGGEGGRSAPSAAPAAAGARSAAPSSGKSADISADFAAQGKHRQSDLAPGAQAAAGAHRGR